MISEKYTEMLSELKAFKEYSQIFLFYVLVPVSNARCLAPQKADS